MSLNDTKISKLGRRYHSPNWDYFKRICYGIAKCNLCKTKLSYRSSISNLKRHLVFKHKIRFENNIRPFRIANKALNKVVKVPLPLSSPLQEQPSESDVFQIHEVSIKNEPIFDESCNSIPIDPISEDASSASQFHELDHRNKKESLSINRSKSSLKDSKCAKSETNEEKVQSSRSLQVYNADRNILFLLSLSEEMKRVPKEVKIHFKAELMMGISKLLQKYS